MTLFLAVLASAPSDEEVHPPDIEFPPGQCYIFIGSQSDVMITISVDIPDVPGPMPIEYDIKIEYHPSSGKEPGFLSMNDYKTSTESSNSSDNIDQEPWKPFRTCLDFEVAELILDSHMNERQKSTLLKLIYKCIKEPGSFTISDTRDLDSTWEQARTYRAAGVRNS